MRRQALANRDFLVLANELIGDLRSMCYQKTLRIGGGSCTFGSRQQPVQPPTKIDHRDKATSALKCKRLLAFTERMCVHLRCDARCIGKSSLTRQKVSSGRTHIPKHYSLVAPLLVAEATGSSHPGQRAMRPAMTELPILSSVSFSVPCHPISAQLASTVSRNRAAGLIAKEFTSPHRPF